MTMLILIAQKKGFDAETTPQITKTNFDGLFKKKGDLTILKAQKLDPFYHFTSFIVDFFQIWS